MTGKRKSYNPADYSTGRFDNELIKLIREEMSKMNAEYKLALEQLGSRIAMVGDEKDALPKISAAICEVMLQHDEKWLSNHEAAVIIQSAVMAYAEAMHNSGICHCED
uniref:Uncharacterized protein n=1 Tax=viral metagenome TaxID=1070528 RepID=A0A6H2A4R7_9ZZZZ